MLKIKASVFIRKEPKAVYSCLKEVERFPEFMRNISQIRILEGAEESKRHVEWTVDVEGAPLKWIQEEQLDEANRRILFRMIRGEYKRFEGEWVCYPDRDGTQLLYAVSVDWGLPRGERIIGSILRRKALARMKGMLFALRDQLNGDHG